ncbi:phosphoglucosamine mutase [Leadbetterella byssophila]|uniref:Phosphoglucomutase/phosphomannomutase alpha/beta/alpha domain I n=1 Tax=Leadbetterella byssophila (strain DSM 17132 / JCM 16389 / KACC 11308 / NBRC 106382 / 4M15) TaxID=649349 RepID=E4RX78_LEAB4|nr:phosphoglucosamine mutase [Leadbetterella byssophila]ADQ18993.1 phosphoglucomutase/phosphomannomutase alpha/beta/alpha domain I [Leadbetterella byssophila DSM 17132]
MTLIKSISGIRGTIGGRSGEALTPLDVVKFTAAFARMIRTEGNKKVVVGRDARPSGKMISDLVCATLNGMGIDVVDLGLSTTPTVEMAVPAEGAAGGIIITASHNPVQWNALKLLNEKGEFISAAEGERLLELVDSEDFQFAEVKQLGKYESNDSYIDKHIEAILALPAVNVEAIQKAEFKVVVDAVNSSGGIAVPKLLKALGVVTVKELNCEPTGQFAHNPEPLPENLRAISSEMKKGDYDLGIVVDPDVDRLALICEDGEPFGEEYTLVAVADYLIGLANENKTTVSNLSSTMALKDITLQQGGVYYSAAVGEVNVVEKMKEVNALIGGEGNGGIIYPELHYGRDALVGIALFLSHLAKFDKPVGFLRKKYPSYFIAKKKIELEGGIDVDLILEKIKGKYAKYEIDVRDGVKILFEKEWVHLRKSNTEPIIRIYAESEFETTAGNLADKIIKDIKELMNS